MGRYRDPYSWAEQGTKEFFLWKRIIEPERPAKEGVPIPPENRPVWFSLVFKAFLDSLGRFERPFVLDLGRLSGDNISFFGSLGWKVYVYDLLRDFQEAAEEARTASPEETEVEESGADPWERTLGGLDCAPGSLHGVLCWDILERLPQAWARELVGRIFRALGTGGLVLSFFGSGKPGGDGAQGRFRILDCNRLEPILDITSHPERRFYQNGEIMSIFSDFSVLNFYLMKNGYRELLVQKRIGAYAAA